MCLNVKAPREPFSSASHGGCRRTGARQGARFSCGGLILKGCFMQATERVRVLQNGPTGSRHLGGGVGVCVCSANAT